MRVALAVAVALGLGSVVVADPSHAAIKRATNIPAQDLGPALKDLAQSRDMQILYFTDTVRNLKTAGAVGEITTDEALTTLLRGTGLTYRYLDDKTITILQPLAESPKAAVTRTQNPTPVSPDAAKGDQKPSFWDRFRLAQVDQGQPPGLNTAETTGTAPGTRAVSIEEVVVTAQKHLERLQDVPVPVTAINGEALASSGLVRLQDYYTKIPGLSVTAGPSSTFNQQIVIRGITTGPYTNPTVGVTVDDVPFGSSTDLGGGNITPDLDPSDLQRIEVLRGPQGTLYGASSMGGLIKFVTVDPSTEEYSGRLQAGTNGVENGNGLGYHFRGSVNAPLSDTVAIRASGYIRRDPGYIDNSTLGIEGINENRVSGGRVAALWRISGDFSLKLSALQERSKADGVNEVTTPSGALEQDFARGIGPSDGTVRAYSATLVGKLGDVDLTALSGYNTRFARHSIDFSPPFGNLAQDLYGVGGVSQITRIDTKKFTQEIRLSAPFGEKVEWLLGGLYAHEDSLFLQDDFAIDLGSGKSVAHAYESTLPMTYAEYAAFADVTLHLTDRFDIQLGGRASSMRQSFQQTSINPLFTGGSTVPNVGPTLRTDAKPFTYLLTPRFKVSPDLMVYARVASGYRAGGPNGNQCTAVGFPCQFEPDKTHNYEVGAKGDLLDHRLSFDASLYRIDWKNIQLFALDPSLAYSFNVNASEAKSEGLELSVEARPLAGLTLATWGVWNQAELTEPFPPAVVSGGAYGAPGDRLPYSSRFSGNVSIDQSFPVGALTASVGAVVSYIGDRKGAFTSSAATPRVDLTGYARTDLHFGVRSDSWNADLFANNLFDKRALVIGGTDLFPPAWIYIQPRTVGLTVAKTF